MNLFFFTYSLSLIVICVITAVLCASAHLVSHKRIFLYATGMFMCYLLDLSIIFQSEFLSQNLIFDPACYYGIESAFIKTIVAGGFLQFLWLAVCDYLDVNDKKLLFIPLGIFLCASLVVITFVPAGSNQQFLYYTARQVFLIWIAIYCIYRQKHARDDIERLRIERFKTPFFIYCILVICIICEDVVFICVLEPEFINPDFPLYLSKRNFSENLLFLLMACCAIQSSIKTLALRFEKPPSRRRRSGSAPY